MKRFCAEIRIFYKLFNRRKIVFLRLSLTSNNRNRKYFIKHSKLWLKRKLHGSKLNKDRKTEIVELFDAE